MLLQAWQSSLNLSNFRLLFLKNRGRFQVLKILRKHAASASTSAKQRNVSLVLCLLTCFSGGVFFATCFLHLFPELTEHLHEVILSEILTFHKEK